MTKASERIFQPHGENLLKFSIRKVHSKKFNSLSAEDKKHAIEWIEDCEKCLQRWKNEIQNSIK